MPYGHNAAWRIIIDKVERNLLVALILNNGIKTLKNIDMLRIILAKKKSWEVYGMLL